MQLISVLESLHLLHATQAAALRAAHAALLQRALTCTLDDRPRLLAREPALQRHADAVLRVAVACGFAFAPMQPTADSG